jgi:eukaryotic-like serine/threonine-protein kinase
MRFNPPLEATEVLEALADSYGSAVPIFVGGQATVFRAVTPAGAAHALKIYYPDPDANVEERTAREVDALRALTTDTLTRLEADGHALIRGTACRFVSTSFIEGQSARDRVKEGPLPVGQVARIGIDVATAVAALWSRRIVHRDVTPNNVMITLDARAVLIDLGLARHTALVSLTLPNHGWGTMGYLSPEQFNRTRALTCKSDMFSLGVVLQECLAGVHPTARDQGRLIQRRAAATSSLAPSLPPAFCAAVDDLMIPAPALRPSPAVVCARLEPFASAI